MKNEVKLSRSEIRVLIDEWIQKEKYRKIMQLRLLNGYTYEKIAEEVDLTPRQIQNIVPK